MSKQTQETSAEHVQNVPPAKGNISDDPDLKEYISMIASAPEEDEWIEPFTDREVIDFRNRLAERLLQPPSFDFLLPFIERLCGKVHYIDQVMAREWTNWREKVVFAHLRDSFPNCEHVVEIARNAQVAVNDVLKIRKYDGDPRVFRVIYSETINDQTFCFLIEI